MDLILPAFKLNLWYSQKLVADVAEDQMCAQPVAGRVMNHPAFLLGHLALVAGNFGTSLVVLPPVCPESWKELFNHGREAAGRPFALSVEGGAAPGAGGRPRPPGRWGGEGRAAVLAQPAPEKIRERFATIGALLAGLMTSHEASHNGQLSAWRRAMGLPPVF